MSKLTVSQKAGGERLDVFVSAAEGITRSYAQKLIESGAVRVNGKTAEKKYKVCEGDTVETEIPPAAPYEVKAEEIPLDVVYEDGDIIVINKPKGMVVHPAAGNYDGTLVNALMAHCGDSLSGIGGTARPGIVHRIDKNTSGLLIVAKNDEAHLALSEQIKEHAVRRIYYAVALGNIPEPITVDKPIGRHPTDRKKMAVTEKNSKRAVTHIYPLEHFSGATLVRCELETGRTHQIRVHLASIGHPILGDDVYGRPKDFCEQKFGRGLCGQTLHAGEIRFIHPRTGESMVLTCPLPDYFEDLLRKLRMSVQ